MDEVKDRVAAACREYRVRRLDAFGSVVRGQETSVSDVDLLVEFFDPEQMPAGRFFGLLHRLETDFGCKVDLLTLNGLRNPFFKARVLAERVPVYEG